MTTTTINYNSKKQDELLINLEISIKTKIRGI